MALKLEARLNWNNYGSYYFQTPPRATLKGMSPRLNMAIAPQQAKDDRKVFDAAFQGFVNDLVQEDKKSSEIGDAIERLKRVSLDSTETIQV